jgi:PST family polysaccharide transporter
LARILAPADFGAAAVATAVASLALLLTDLGIGPAIVQRTSPDEAFLTTAFLLNALSGLALTGITISLSGWLAGVLGEPALTTLLPIASLTFSISLGVVHRARLERDLRFGVLATIEISASVVSMVVSITAALAGGGAAAIVLGPVVRAGLMSIMQWSVGRWRPRSRPSWGALCALWRFQRGLVGSQLVQYTARNFDTLLLAKATTAAQLGFYNRAFNLMQVPVQQVGYVLNRALLPSLSRLAETRNGLGRAVRRATRAGFALGGAVGVLVAAAAPALIETVFGAKWLPMVPLLVLLSLAGPPQIVVATLNPVYMALGKNDLRFRLGLVQAALTVVAIIVGLPWQASGVAMALLIKSWTVDPISIVIAWRLLGLSSLTLGVDLGRIAVAMCSSAGLTLLVGRAMSSGPPPLTLITQTSVFCVSYLLGLLLMSREVMEEFVPRLRRFPVGEARARRGPQ